MSSLLNSVRFPAPMTGTRAPASAVRGRLSRGAYAVWRFLEQAGCARARQHLLLLAQHYQITSPELAQQLRAACDPAPPSPGPRPL
jgi:hypothetical protein